MHQRRSELQQPVAVALFSTPRPERQRRALSVLRELRDRVAVGGKVLAELAGLPVLIEREFARFELRRALPQGLELEALDRDGDTALRLWLIDRALKACGALHRGGHFVTSGPRRVA